MAKNSALIQAGVEKKDEFYTQLTDIEKEMKYYKKYFEGKTVFCNCDDPDWSNFFKYFQLNFWFLGLKKLIATHYEADKPTYKLEIIADEKKNGQVGIPEYKKTMLTGNGDFRSDECIELLKEADIVCTNPPFSLFREYIAQLVKYDKKFIIIGNMNAITYKEVFPLIKENKLWYGASIHSGDRKFYVPDDYPLNASNCGVDETGRKFIRVKGVRWFTNLDYKARHEDLVLYKTYTPEEYPKFDEYDAINVNKAAEIPCDYFGIMGVPISFLDKYNPDQFEIIGEANHGSDSSFDLFKPIINNKIIFKRILIKRK